MDHPPTPPPPPPPPPPSLLSLLGADVSSSLIVTVALEAPRVAPPVGVASVTTNDSEDSWLVSFATGMLIVFALPSPSAHDKVPVDIVKSDPALADPVDVE